jgi:pimeloyl-ACP methyl ester carboxylesterase
VLAMGSKLAPIYEFGPFRLETSERRLVRDGRSVSLHGKLFDTLVVLIRNAGRLVEKDDLIGTVWPDAAVEETNLSHNISIIRKTLGETSSGLSYVETVPKHGYRFIGEVREITHGSDDVGAMPRRRLPVPSTRYTKSGDVAVAYQTLGDGPFDLVYVPGWISHLEYGWQQPRVAHLFRRLASFSRLILFDKRGTGLSDRGHGYPSLEERMDDVRAVMDAARSERAALFGMSEGGNMSALFAATYPERTRALVLYGTFAKRIWSPDYPWAPRPEERQRWYELLEREWGGKMDLDTLAPSLSDDKEFSDWWSTYLRLGASPGAALALARFNTEVDIRDVLPAVQAPTLVLHRVGDRDVKVEEGRYLAARIPRASFTELPGDDHLIYAGDLNQIVDEVRSFLESQITERVGPVEQVLSTIVAIHTDKDVRSLERILAQQCTLQRGKVLPSSATSCVAAFDGPGRAIRAACATVGSGRRTDETVRAGIHTGECDLRSGLPNGLPVTMATRLAAAADPGAVVTTRTVKELVAVSTFHFEPRGAAVLAECGEWPIYEARLC